MIAIPQQIDIVHIPRIFPNQFTMQWSLKYFFWISLTIERMIVWYKIVLHRDSISVEIQSFDIFVRASMDLSIHFSHFVQKLRVE